MQQLKNLLLYLENMSTGLSTHFQDIISDDHHVKEMLMCSGYQFGDDLQIFEFKSALSSLFLTLVSFFFSFAKVVDTLVW